MRISAGLVAATCAACAACAACAPPDDLVGPSTSPDITTTVRQLAVTADIEGNSTARTLTLSFDERVVWSCSLESKCASDDVWYQGPGLYTFAMGDDFASDVYVHDEVVRVELYVRGEVREDDGTLDLWHVDARAFADGNGIATLARSDRSFSFANTSGVELMKQSMTAALERWDGEGWREVPRAHIFLCGTGWNPLVSVDEVEHVYLPLHAHQRAMAAQNIDPYGTFRVRYPFRVIDEEQPRMATLLMELDEDTFAPPAYDH